MKPTKPNLPYRFTSSQRKGILALILLIVVSQFCWLLYGRYMFGYSAVNQGKKTWLEYQKQLDSLKAKTDSTSHKLYPFNPNFISDYKGYTLGLTTVQINRLKAYRSEGKWINSAADFKKVSGVSDSLLTVISPYFKFPDWVVNKNATTLKSPISYKEKSAEKKQVVLIGKSFIANKIDINIATDVQFEAAYGIGPAFARRIIKKRADLGAFVSMDQMDEFAEFSPEAIADLKKRFFVDGSPKVNKINVNNASLNQLSRFPYFNREIARSIVTARAMDGKIDNFEEFVKIQPEILGKLKIISLYLEY